MVCNETPQKKAPGTEIFRSVILILGSKRANPTYLAHIPSPTYIPRCKNNVSSSSLFLNVSSSLRCSNPTRAQVSFSPLMPLPHSPISLSLSHIVSFYVMHLSVSISLIFSLSNSLCAMDCQFISWVRKTQMLFLFTWYQIFKLFDPIILVRTRVMFLS